MATNETLTELDSLPLPAEGTDLLYVVRSNTSYKATVADLPSTGGGGVDTVGTIDSETKSANGAVISGNDIIMQTADTTHVGLVTRATVAEQQSGTDTAKYSTPETVAGAYNAYAPTVITSSSTLTTSTSMIIATGAGGYATTLPDAATFPASQLGKPIYYVNNSGAANTIGVETGGFTSVTLSITGATTTPPLYALSSTTLPTVTSMTIASNVATATANSASAQTFDYVTSNNILQVTPKMTFTNGNVLSIDPTSTTGSTKFNYSVSNTVQVGSKIQVDVGGTVSEITVAAGSQTSNAVFDSSWGSLFFKSANNILFAMGVSNRKLAYSMDNGNSWIFSATIAGTGIAALTSIVYFNGSYYLGVRYGVNQGTINLWKSTDLINWVSANSQTFSNAGSCGVMTDGNILLITYAQYIGNSVGNSMQVFSSTNGTVFNSLGSVTFAGNDAFIVHSHFENGYFCVGANQGVSYSANSGVSWLVSRPGGSEVDLYYTGSIFISSTSTGVYTSSNFTTWTQQITYTNNASNISFNGFEYIVTHYSDNAYYASSNGTTWTTQTLSGAAFGSSVAVNNNAHFFANSTSQIAYDGNINGNSWNTVNLATSSGYTFTMTSPSIVVPTWAGLGGQNILYSVSSTSTPSFNISNSPTYIRAGNNITINYASIIPSPYNHFQLKGQGFNSGDILTQIGADLHIDVDFNATISPNEKVQIIPTSTAGYQLFRFAG